MDKQTKRYRIGLIALTIILLHVVLSLYFFVAPAQFRVRHKIVNVYRQLVLLGPFFTESRIHSTHYLSFRYKRENNWSTFRNLGREQFVSYQENPWRWDKLSQIGYQRHLAYTIGELATRQSFEAIKRNSAFRELNGFLHAGFIPVAADSIQIVGSMESYIPKSRAYRQDTVFMFTYNPSSIGDVKK